MVFLAPLSGFSNVGSVSVRNISLYSNFRTLSNPPSDLRVPFGRVVRSGREAHICSVEEYRPTSQQVCDGGHGGSNQHSAISIQHSAPEPFFAVPTKILETQRNGYFCFNTPRFLLSYVFQRFGGLLKMF